MKNYLIKQIVFYKLKKKLKVIEIISTNHITIY